MRIDTTDLDASGLSAGAGQSHTEPGPPPTTDPSPMAADGLTVEPIRVCVLNLSGNVGKSVVAMHMLAPRLHATVIRVETINSDGAAADAERYKGSEFDALYRRILATDSNVVVDVGSSNVERFLQRLQEYDGSHEDFDLFVVPVTPPTKQQTDTVNTIGRLRELDVPAARIRVVFNRVEPDADIEADFSLVWDLGPEMHTTVPGTAIRETEMFDRLRSEGLTLQALMADPTDHRARLRHSRDPDERAALVRSLALERLGRSCSRNLDEAFERLMDGL